MLAVLSVSLCGIFHQGELLKCGSWMTRGKRKKVALVPNGVAVKIVEQEEERMSFFNQ